MQGNDNHKLQDRGAQGGASKILFNFKLMMVASMLYVCCEYYFVCFNYLVNFFILKIKKGEYSCVGTNLKIFFKIQRKRTKKQKNDERKVYLWRTLDGHNYTFFIIIIL